MAQSIQGGSLPAMPKKAATKDKNASPEALAPTDQSRFLAARTPRISYPYHTTLPDDFELGTATPTTVWSFDLPSVNGHQDRIARVAVGRATEQHVSLPCGIAASGPCNIEQALVERIGGHALLVITEADVRFRDRDRIAPGQSPIARLVHQHSTVFGFALLCSGDHERDAVEVPIGREPSPWVARSRPLAASTRRPLWQGRLFPAQPPVEAHTDHVPSAPATRQISILQRGENPPTLQRGENPPTLASAKPFDGIRQSRHRNTSRSLASPVARFLRTARL